MTDTYSAHAAICAKFYELTLSARQVADFVFAKGRVAIGDRALFVGGMFSIAGELALRGLSLTVVDYTDEMVAIGTSRLPNCRVQKSDLRALPFHEEFDTIFVVGRVFTHMILDADLLAALESCRRSLRPNGKLLVDNYEDSRIQVTDYFNGRIDARDDTSTITRISTTSRVSEVPLVVTWRACYHGEMDGSSFAFEDTMEHRAFSRAEFASYLSQIGFQLLEQGDNFDETSFYTLAQRTV
jgi:SAM-dependent methyltransferase